MLKLEKITKEAGKFSLVNVDMTVEKGDYFTLIGESGAGKSMLLEIIAGLMLPDSGEIILNGRSLLKLPTQKRNMGIVYQKPSLFPHMSVLENIAFPLKTKKMNKAEIKNTIRRLAEDTEITHLLNRRVGSLSGGEAQRVTIARALATKPEILLLDEPLSFLDVHLKRDMLSLLRKLHQRGQTIIHVTHDYEEALSLTNKIAIIENGFLIQSGTPEEIFQHPKSAFVAGFVGIQNFFNGRLLKPNDQTGFKIFKTSEIEIYTNSPDEVNSEGTIMIPAEDISLLDEKPISDAVNKFYGTILDRYQTRKGFEIVIDIGIEMVLNISGISADRSLFPIGKKVGICFEATSVHFAKCQSINQT